MHGANQAIRERESNYTQLNVHANFNAIHIFTAYDRTGPPGSEQLANSLI